MRCAEARSILHSIRHGPSTSKNAIYTDVYIHVQCRVYVYNCVCLYVCNYIYYINMYIYTCIFFDLMISSSFFTFSRFLFKSVCEIKLQITKACQSWLFPDFSDFLFSRLNDIERPAGLIVLAQEDCASQLTEELAQDQLLAGRSHSLRELMWQTSHWSRIKWLSSEQIEQAYWGWSVECRGSVEDM